MSSQVMASWTCQVRSGYEDWTAHDKAPGIPVASTVCKYKVTSGCYTLYTLSLGLVRRDAEGSWPEPGLDCRKLLIWYKK